MIMLVQDWLYYTVQQQNIIMISGILKSIKNTFKTKQQPQKDLIIENVKTVTGKAFQKKYIKHRKLGSGAFAQCYLTENIQTKKVYATKIISKNNQNRAKLLNQLVIHQQLHHENIVDFSHAFQDQNDIYVFMELCTNDSLEHLLQKKYILSTPQIQKFIFQIIQGVKYIHSKNLIHRDLKPKNIFLGEQNTIKIGDFGLACKLQFEDDRKNVSCGTPQYMAPEQIDGRSYGKQVDVWAIGILLYQMYVGRTPFLDTSNQLIKDNIRNLEYVYSEKGIPKQALALIKRILIRNPQLRLTLDQILQSSFFKGQQAEINSLLSPRKLSSFNINFEQSSVMKSANSSKLQHSAIPEQLKLKTKSPYISEVQQVGTEIILYTMSNGSVGLYAKNKQIIHEGNKQINIPLSKINERQDNEKSQQNSKFRMILKNYKMKKQNNAIDELSTPRKLEKYVEEVYLTKFSKHRNIFICRLSNNHIQLRFEDKTSLLTSLSNLSDNTIYINEHNIITQITQKELFLNENNDLKGIDEDKIKYAKRIYKSLGITQTMQQRKELQQESNPIDHLN